MAGLLDIIEAAPKAALGVVGGLLGMGGPPAAPAAAAAPGAAPPGPGALLSPQGYMHPGRDAFLQFLGGAAGRLDQSLQQHDMQRFERDRSTAILNSLPDEYKAAYAMDPQGFTAEFMKNYGPQNVTGGNTVFYGGPTGPARTAPKLDNANGHGFTQTPAATTVTGATGPAFTIRDHTIVDANGVEAAPAGVTRTDPELPTGYVPGKDGTPVLAPWFLTGQRQLADTRRDAIVSKPMPSHAKGAVAHGPNVPSGFVLDHH